MLRNLFKGQKIYLTAPRAGDEQVMARWFEDSEYLRLVDTDVAFPKSAETLSKRSPEGGPLYEFAIREAKGDELVGFVALHSIEWGNQAAMLAIGIGDANARHKGYGNEAMSLILQYAFCELGLHRVGLDVIAYNEVAELLYERHGFAVEGRTRECVYRDNKRYDRIYMGLLRHEWLAKQHGL